MDSGRYKVRKEPSPAKRCEKSRKDAKRAMFYGRKTDSACTDFCIIRSRFYRVNSLKELFDKVEPVRIFLFLKEIRLYNKI